MTPSPQCCSRETTLNEVANLMVEADCGEIPVTDASNRLVGIGIREAVAPAHPPEHCGEVGERAIEGRGEPIGLRGHGAKVGTNPGPGKRAGA